MNFQRLFDILPYQRAKYPKEKALAHRQSSRWKTFSTQECIETIDRLSTGLLRLGLKSGDRAAILAHCGSPVWHFVDLALQQTGVVVVPIHATVLGKDLAFILEDAAIRCCFVSNREMLEKVSSATAGAMEVFSFEKIQDVRHWEELLASPTPAETEALEALKTSIPDVALATVIYTSGTTGLPKGVMLTHRNIVSNIKAILTLVPVNYRMDALSFLPLSHIFERMVTCLYMAAGTSVWYSESPDAAFEDMRDVRPHFFTAVPRILEKMHDQAQEERSKLGALGRKIFDQALAWGKNYDPLEKLSPVFWLRHQLFDWLVYRRWRRMLGGRVEGIVVGAAALQVPLAKLLCAAGIPTREGYGLTETSPVVAFNHFEPGLYRHGTVGIPIPGMEVKIDTPDEQGEGEILVKGPNVMSGYLNQPEETAAVFTEDGWLRTGDAGCFEQRRFLKITGRKRDFFKTSSGKFVAPQRVELHLQQSPFIRQVMVTGVNQTYPSALIVPDFTALELWCREHGVHWTAPQFMALNPKVMKFMESVIEELNESLEPHERVKKFTLLHEEWTPQNGELTFTMKLARQVIGEKFSKEIEEMYKT
jgi:long-chain acyl-CoA synthetase